MHHGLCVCPSTVCDFKMCLFALFAKCAGIQTCCGASWRGIRLAMTLPQHGKLLRNEDPCCVCHIGHTCQPTLVPPQPVFLEPPAFCSTYGRHRYCKQSVKLNIVGTQRPGSFFVCLRCGLLKTQRCNMVSQSRWRCVAIYVTASKCPHITRRVLGMADWDNSATDWAIALCRVSSLVVTGLSLRCPAGIPRLTCHYHKYVVTATPLQYLSALAAEYPNQYCIHAICHLGIRRPTHCCNT